MNIPYCSSIQAQVGSSSGQRLNEGKFLLDSFSRASYHDCAQAAGSRSSLWGSLRLRATKPGKCGRPVGWPVGL